MSEVPDNHVPSYLPHRHHRDRHPEKSQWTISEEAEIACFELAWAREWYEDSHAWGLHPDQRNRPAWLGQSADGASLLWFAKFVEGSDWHGYPADLARRQRHDAPCNRVARNWYSERYIRKATLSKLVQGKICVP